MEKTLKKVAPTPELLQEMEELDVLGGTGSNDNNVYALAKCTVYGGNCVPQCGCTIIEDPEKDDPSNDDPSKP